MDADNKFWNVSLRRAATRQSGYGYRSKISNYYIELRLNDGYESSVYLGRLYVSAPIPYEKQGAFDALAKEVYEWVTPSYDFLLNHFPVDMEQVTIGNQANRILGNNNRIVVNTKGLSYAAQFTGSNSIEKTDALIKTIAMMEEDGRSEPGKVDAVRWLILNSKGYKESMKDAEVRRLAERVVRGHSEDLRSVVDACARMFPLQGQWGNEYLDSLIFYSEFVVSKVANKTCREVHVAESFIMQKIFDKSGRGYSYADIPLNMLPQEVKSLKISDITPAMASEAVRDVHKIISMPSSRLPIHIKMFSEFAKNLTVEQYVSLLNLKEITPRTSGAAAIQIAEDFLNGDNKVNISLDNAVEAYYTFAKCCKGELRSQDLRDFNTMMLGYFDSKTSYGNFYAAMCAYVAGESDKSLTAASVKDAFEILSSHADWVRSYESANYVVGKLLSLGGYKQLFYVLRDVKNANGKLTVAQWNKYFDNYEEVKDQPFDWWGNLIL